MKLALELDSKGKPNNEILNIMKLISDEESLLSCLYKYYFTKYIDNENKQFELKLKSRYFDIKNRDSDHRRYEISYTHFTSYDYESILDTIKSRFQK